MPHVPKQLEVVYTKDGDEFCTISSYLVIVNILTMCYIFTQAVIIGSYLGQTFKSGVLETVTRYLTLF